MKKRKRKKGWTRNTRGEKDTTCLEADTVIQKREKDRSTI
jgi:hypothetical protein